MEDEIKIPLTQGQVALIRRCQLPLVQGVKWQAHRNRKHATYYAVRMDGRKTVRMHRVLMGAKPGELVDHINRNGLDNRPENLRIATRRENAGNTKMPSHNTSGYRGVTWDKRREKWQSQITIRGKNVILGRFEIPAEAARAYDRAAREHFGEFATLNFPDVT